MNIKPKVLKLKKNTFFSSKSLRNSKGGGDIGTNGNAKKNLAIRELWVKMEKHDDYKNTFDYFYQFLNDDDDGYDYQDDWDDGEKSDKEGDGDYVSAMSIDKPTYEDVVEKLMDNFNSFYKFMGHLYPNVIRSCTITNSLGKLWSSCPNEVNNHIFTNKNKKFKNLTVGATCSKNKELKKCIYFVDYEKIKQIDHRHANFIVSLTILGYIWSEKCLVPVKIIHPRFKRYYDSFPENIVHQLIKMYSFVIV